jgi:hypothetical protein
VVDIKFYKRVGREGEGEDKETLWVSSNSFNRDRIFTYFKFRKGRVETVLMFAQAVYLMFSSVYVCKESVEHLLLSAGGGEGHHHHRGDEEVGLGCVLTF